MSGANEWAGIAMWRAHIPGEPAGVILPMLAVCTVPDAALVPDVDNVDVAEEYTSWVWFYDRATWRLAYRMARMIARGHRFHGGLLPNYVSADLSRHHVDGVAA